jgi:hypothetical protein
MLYPQTVNGWKIKWICFAGTGHVWTSGGFRWSNQVLKVTKYCAINLMHDTLGIL